MNAAVLAIFKRDLKRWFGNPTGYVFISLFVALAAASLFWPDQFFLNNLANLDTLNRWFPILLLFFVPAVTMNVWAGERSHGTDELLLTLPVSDGQIILGKFLAAAGIYTIALMFCLPLLFFLGYLGDPDWGLILANMLGNWLLGLTLIAAGMVGSQLSDNLTVAFIIGGIFCGLIVLSEQLVAMVIPESLARAWVGYGPISLFGEMGRGVVTLPAILLFAGLIVAFLYLNRLFLSRRHWSHKGAEGTHLSVRFACLLVSAVALTGIGANAGQRIDLTSESVHSLSDETREMIASLDDSRPIYVQAFLSPEVPREYVQTRRTLLDLLREYDALGGNKIRVRVVEAERYSEEARAAESRYQITPVTRTLPDQDGRFREFDLMLGVVFTCGLEEIVIPFFDRGLPVEYELTRSIRVVSSARRRKVGIVDTDIKVFGGFDFQSMRQDPKWHVVTELELQYEVTRVDPKADYPADLDALVALMASSLNQEDMDRLGAYVKSGKPTLLIDDPFPATAPGHMPTEPKGGPQNPFQQQGQPPPEPKGDIRGLLRDVGILWPYDTVIWDQYNPHPQMEYPPEVVFVGARSGAKDPFNSDELVSSGLQELVAFFSGYVEPGRVDGIRFTPLIQTSPGSGELHQSELFQRNPLFGGMSINPMRRHIASTDEYTLAAKVKGKASEGDVEVNLIFMADLDMVSGQFFELRRQGADQFNLDNVTFLLNCVDELAGDSSFVELRKRRPRHRTLTKIEQQEEVFEAELRSERDKAESAATAKLDEAQMRLDEKVAKIRESTELDEQSKAIRIQSVQNVEQRKLDVRKASIEDEKNRAIENARGTKFNSVESIRTRFRVGGLMLAPIPAILVGIWSVMRRKRRESEQSRKAGRFVGDLGGSK